MNIRAFLIPLFLVFSTHASFGDASPFGGGGASGPNPFGGDDNTSKVRETFRVSQVNALNRPKLFTLFDECRKNYVLMDNGTTCTREAADALIREIQSANEAARAKAENEKGLVRGMIVFQRLNARAFLTQTWWSNDLVYIAAKSDLDAFDGDRLPPMYLLRSGDYAYTAINGAARNIRAFVQTKEYSEAEDALKAPKTAVPKYSELTRETFVNALKAGASFTAERIEAESCKTCSGRGTLSHAAEGMTLEIRRETCPRCNGAGHTDVRKEYTIVW